MPNEKDTYLSTNGRTYVNSPLSPKKSEYNDDKTHFNLNNSQESAYARLSPLRRAIRSFLLPLITYESHIIARIQHRFRSPFLDAYFVYTSSLGTHTFFMILLPAMFFFGFRQVGMGLVLVMGLGVYGSSWMKDFVCSPRPLAPPVMRLTLGNHHLEYGFPSTHSTNSVSIALFFWGYLHASSLSPFSSSASDENSSPTITYIFFCFLLLLYTISIVFGRIYTAMHSFTDCLVGVVLGAIIWVGVTDAESGGGLGLAWGRRLEEWVTGAHTVGNIPSLTPPLVLTTVFLTLVNQHPQPVDDCPCFEDALAMGAVVYGALLGRWACVYFGMDGLVERVGGPRPMVGSGWVLLKEEFTNATSAFGATSSVNATEYPLHTTTWIASFSTSPLWEILLFTLTALAKLVLGISMIFVWRLFAKSVLGLVLPSVFRAVARIVAGIRSRLGPGYEWLSMPNRRFYLPATEYQGGVPNELVLGGGSGTRGRSGQDFNSKDGGRAGNGGYEFDPDFAHDDEEETDYEEEYLDVGSGSGANTNGNKDTLGIPRQRGRVKERRGRIMRPIPSVIDLPASLTVGVEDQGGIGSDSGGTKNHDMKVRRGVGGEENGSAEEANGVSEGARKSKHMKHYDADVLTKVIVYAGIAILSIEITPLVFELLGWGVYVWPPEGVRVVYN